MTNINLSSNGSALKVELSVGVQEAVYRSLYADAVQRGFSGSFDDFLATLKGEKGKSAYEVAVENGFVGTQAEWLASLKANTGTSDSAPVSQGLKVDSSQLVPYAETRQKIEESGFEVLEEQLLLPVGEDGLYLTVQMLKRGRKLPVKVFLQARAVLNNDASSVANGAVLYRMTVNDGIHYYDGKKAADLFLPNEGLRVVNGELFYLARGLNLVANQNSFSAEGDLGLRTAEERELSVEGFGADHHIFLPTNRKELLSDFADFGAGSEFMEVWVFESNDVL